MAAPARDPLALIRRIVAGDAPGVVRMLDLHPELASAPVIVGATRRNPADYFFTAILHYVYERDTALHLAAACYNRAIVADLLRRGAPPGAKNRRGAEPLHYAVDGGPGAPHWNERAQPPVIAALVDAGADVDAVDAGGVTPLHRAVRNRCASAVEALVARGAGVRRPNGAGSTALHLAVQQTGRGGTGARAAGAHHRAPARRRRALVRPRREGAERTRDRQGGVDPRDLPPLTGVQWSPMFRFLHCADVHLDSPLQGLAFDDERAKTIRAAPRRAFENLIDLAIREEVRFVLIAGDLYDGDWRDYNTGVFFANQVARLFRHGIPTYIVAGNHDASNTMTRELKAVRGMHVLRDDAPETRRLEDLGVAIHGQSYERAEMQDDLAKSYPKPVAGLYNIGLLHTAASRQKRDGHLAYAPCVVGDLVERGYDYWALGHVHLRQSLGRAPHHVEFPGNVQGRHVRETGAKGCLVVEVDEARRTRVEFHATDVVRWARCVVEDRALASADDALEAAARAVARESAAAEDRPLVARVELQVASEVTRALHGRPDHHRAELERRIADLTGGRPVWLESVRATSPAVSRAVGAVAVDGAHEELDALFRRAATDDALVDELIAELARGKLPADLQDADTDLALGDRDAVRRLLAEVEPLLLKRLQGEP